MSTRIAIGARVRWISTGINGTVREIIQTANAWSARVSFDMHPELSKAEIPFSSLEVTEPAPVAAAESSLQPQLDAANEGAKSRPADVSADLLAIVRRFVALDGGAWNVDRHASEKAQLLADAEAALVKAGAQ